jgi:hypothetical protein
MLADAQAVLNGSSAASRDLDPDEYRLVIREAILLLEPTEALRDNLPAFSSVVEWSAWCERAEKALIQYPPEVTVKNGEMDTPIGPWVDSDFVVHSLPERRR